MDYQAPERVAAKSRVPAPSSPIEERNSADLSYAEFFREYVTTGRPVIVRNATPAWPALSKWSPEFFKTHFAEKMVQVSYNEQMSFAEFIDRVMASTEDAPGPYMYRLFLHEHLPEVLPDLAPQNQYAFPRRLASPLMMEYWRRPDGYLKLLIGGIGGRFPVMHFDAENAHATITEIYGDKEFVVYAPSDTPYLYPSEKRVNHSSVDDPLNQDLERFPLLAHATQYRGLLRPGDMVFVPCRWWHTARALSPSISVGMNILADSNWSGFVSEICGPLDYRRPGKLLKRAYFQGLGPLLSALEAVQMKFPALADRLLVPRILAPNSSSVAPDPSLSPLKIRVQTG